jgi:hypothetical protein
MDSGEVGGDDGIGKGKNHWQAVRLCCILAGEVELALQVLLCDLVVQKPAVSSFPVPRGLRGVKSTEEIHFHGHLEIGK